MLEAEAKERMLAGKTLDPGQIIEQGQNRILEPQMIGFGRFLLPHARNLNFSQHVECEVF